MLIVKTLRRGWALVLVLACGGALAGASSVTLEVQNGPWERFRQPVSAALTAEQAQQAAGCRLVEIGPVREVVQRPHHPYTTGLMGAIPTAAARAERLVQIPGSMPRLAAIPAGCAFHPRCPYVQDVCRVEVPEAREVGTGHIAACHFAGTPGLVRRERESGEVGFCA